MGIAIKTVSNTSLIGATAWSGKAHGNCTADAVAINIKSCDCVSCTSRDSIDSDCIVVVDPSDCSG